MMTNAALIERNNRLLATIGKESLLEGMVEQTNNRLTASCVELNSGINTLDQLQLIGEITGMFKAFSFISKEMEGDYQTRYATSITPALNTFATCSDNYRLVWRSKSYLDSLIALGLIWRRT